MRRRLADKASRRLAVMGRNRWKQFRQSFSRAKAAPAPPPPPGAGPPAAPPPPAPAPSGESSWKRYLEAVAARGERVDKVSLIAVTALALLFFGFILPSMPNIDRVAQLRARSDRDARLMRRLEARQSWAVTSADTYRYVTPMFCDEEPSSDDLSRFAKTMKAWETARQDANYATYQDWCRLSAAGCITSAPGLNQLQQLCGSLERVEEQHNTRLTEQLTRARKELAEWMENAKGGAFIDESLKLATKELAAECQSLRGWELNMPWARARWDLCRQLSALRDQARKEQNQREFARLQSSGLSLKFLGLFGIEAKGIEEVQLPLLYLPLLWSCILLGFLFQAGQAREVMLNLFARAIRLRLEGVTARPLPREVVDDIAGVPHAPWWWLAPLPRGVGAGGLDAETFRSALGWRHFHFAATAGTVLCLGTLLLMQAVVFLIGASLTYAFTDGNDFRTLAEQSGKVFTGAFGPLVPSVDGSWEAWVIVPALAALTLTNTALVLRWLWPWWGVPDHFPNQEKPWHFRRLVLGALFIGGAGAALALLRQRPKLPTAALLVEPSPRFRRPRPVRAVSAGVLQPGFYLHRKTGTVHYVTPAAALGVRERTRPELRRKRRRLPLIQFERRIQQARVAAWREAGAPPAQYPRQARTRTAGARTEPPAPPDGARIRRAGRIRIDSLVPATLRAFFPLPQEAPATGRPNPGAMAFAVEQEALQWMKKAGSTGGAERETAVDQACELLHRAITNRRPGDRSVLRLCDLLAVIAHRNGRKQVFEWLIAEAEKARWREPAAGTDARFAIRRLDLPELAHRAASWKDSQSGWHRRWSKRTKWAGLPM